MAADRQDGRPKWNPEAGAYVDDYVPRQIPRAIGEEELDPRSPAPWQGSRDRFPIEGEGNAERAAEAEELVRVLGDASVRVATTLRDYLAACEEMGRVAGIQGRRHKDLIEAQMMYDSALSRFRAVAQVSEGWRDPEDPNVPPERAAR